MAESPEFRKLEFANRVRGKVEDVFAFHTHFENILTILPPYPRVRIMEAPKKLSKDDTFAVGLFFLPLIGIFWESRVIEFEENRRFVDKQISVAPFAFWLHEHDFFQDGDYCQIIDRVRYKLHFGIIGKIVDYVLIRHFMHLFFYYRSIYLKKIFG